MKFFASSLLRQTAAWYLFAKGVVYDGVSTAYSRHGNKVCSLPAGVLCNKDSVFAHMANFNLGRFDPFTGEMQASAKFDFNTIAVSDSHAFYASGGELKIFDSASLSCLGTVHVGKVLQILAYGDRAILLRPRLPVLEVRNLYARELSIKSHKVLIRGSYMYFANQNSSISVYDLDTETLVFESKAWWTSDSDIAYHDGMVFVTRFKTVFCYDGVSDKAVRYFELDSWALRIRISGSLVFCQSELGSVYVLDARTLNIVDKLLAQDLLTEAVAHVAYSNVTFRFSEPNVHVYRDSELIAVLDDPIDVIPYMFQYQAISIRIRDGVCEGLQTEWDIVRLHRKKDYPHLIDLRDEYGSGDVTAWYSSIVFFGTSVDELLYPVILTGDEDDKKLEAYLKQKYGRDVQVYEAIHVAEDCAFLQKNTPGALKVVSSFSVADHEARVLEFVEKYAEDMISVRADGELRYGLREHQSHPVISATCDSQK